MTGQRIVSVLLMKIEMPWPKGSVLDLRRCILMTEGDELLSTARSEKQMEGRPPKAEVVNSPDLRKPKKARQQAAQRRRES